jgi:hypothetical protein
VFFRVKHVSGIVFGRPVHLGHGDAHRLLRQGYDKAMVAAFGCRLFPASVPEQAPPPQPAPAEQLAAQPAVPAIGNLPR